MDRKRRHKRIRAAMTGTEKKPRLVVFRSINHVYASLIDDEKNMVLAHASDMALSKKAKGKPVEIAKEVGKLIAQKAKEQKIAKVVFDRAGYKFHGKVKALAEGAREGGLEF